MDASEPLPGTRSELCIRVISVVNVVAEVRCLTLAHPHTISLPRTGVPYDCAFLSGCHQHLLAWV